MGRVGGEAPSRCVVDTGVAIAAIGDHPEATGSCVAASTKALRAIMVRGYLVIDDGQRIVDESRDKLRAPGRA